MIKRVSVFLFTSVLAMSASAQEMPAPRRMPRVPVSREALVQPQMPVAREIQGLAAIIDGEKLRIGENDLRLFGVVPPQLAASFGPQARAELDTLANGQNVTCQIRDRDRDGRLLATCHNANSIDMALDLLKHGLAVTARGSIAGTELATPYAAAEQVAQNQKLGLWSVSAGPPTVATAAPTPQATKQETPKQDTIALNETNDLKKDEKTAVHPDKASTPDTQTQAKIAADVLAQQAQTQARLDDTLATAGSYDVGFFERYQILIAGFLMLTTALCVIGALWVQKARDRRDEVKALAAALRGELMAARSICLGRAKSISADIEDRLAIWPRIRSTLYQAYVGRLGLLGAELARQVASIYGQSSDYTALYNATGNTASQEVPKKQALEMLAKRIEEVLPKLAETERTGKIRVGGFKHARSEAVIESGGSSSLIAKIQAVAVPPSQAVIHAALLALENARSFIQNYYGSPPSSSPAPVDPQVSEYTAIIEADMALYQDKDHIESLDIMPIKKQG